MKVLTTLALIMSFSASLLAKEPLSNSFLEVFNNGNRVEVIDFLSKNMSKSRVETYGIDAHVGVFLNEQNTYGTLKLLKQLPEKNNSENLLVTSANNKLVYKLIINRENTQPFGINYFSLEDAKPDNDNSSTDALSPKQLEANLSIFIEQLEKKEAFSGSVLVAKGKDIIFEKAVGLANK